MLRHPLNAGTERAAVSAQEKNYSKILEIQGQLVSAQVFGAVYPALLDLASRHRIFINEIDLKKVCRKSNKLFRFWLFNDCLIYGCLLESGQYLFHRKIDLVTCYIMIYKSLVYKYALEVAGAEKSFIVMAKNEYEQMHWMNAVLDAIANLRGSPSLNSDSNPNVTFHKSHPQLDVTSSPFWDTSYDAGTPPLSPESSRCLDLRSELSLANIKDSKSQHSSTLKSAKTNCCSICNEVFGVFIRRYECTYCGLAVCLQHSTHKSTSAQGMTPDFYRTCDCCLSDMRSDDTDEDEGLNEPGPSGRSTRPEVSPRRDCQEQSPGRAEEAMPPSQKVFKPAPPPKPCRSPIPMNPQSPLNGHTQPPSDVFGAVGSTRPAFRTYTTPPRTATDAYSSAESCSPMHGRSTGLSPPASLAVSTSQELPSSSRAHSAAEERPRSRSQGMLSPSGCSSTAHTDTKTAHVGTPPKPKTVTVAVPVQDIDADPDLPQGSFQQRLEAMKKKSAAISTKPAAPQLSSTATPRMGSAHLSPPGTNGPADKLFQTDRPHQSEGNDRKIVNEMHEKTRDPGSGGMGERKQFEGSPASKGAQFSHYGGGQIYGKRIPMADPNKPLAQSPGRAETQGSNSHSNLPSPLDPTAQSPPKTVTQQRAPVPATIPVLRPGTPAVGGSQHVTVASQIFREKLEAMNSRSIVPPPRARSVPEPPQTYSAQSTIVFGIPDEAEPFVFENPLQQANQSRNASPTQCALPNRANFAPEVSTTTAALSAPPPPVPQPLVTAKHAPPPPAPAPVLVSAPSTVPASSTPAPPRAVVPPPPAVDPATAPRWDSHTHALSPTPSPKRAPSTGFADRISQFNSANSSPALKHSTLPDRVAPMRQKAAEDNRSPDSNGSALCVQETRSASPFKTEKLVAHSAPPKHASVKETRETNVHMKSSCQLSDTKASQPRPPSSSLSFSSSSVTKQEVDSGSTDSTSSRTTIESKVSTSTVTYQYEYDVDDEEDIPAPPGHGPRNSPSQVQKMPKGFKEKEVRRKMEADGVSPDVIEEFLRHIGAQCGPDNAPSRPSTAFPVSGKVQVLPPPPASSCESRAGGGSSAYATYSKMVSMRVPEGAVRQKMAADGFSSSEVDAYFTALRTGDGSELRQVTSRSTLPPPPPPPPAPPAPAPPAPLSKGTAPPAPPGGTSLAPQKAPSSAPVTAVTKENMEKNKKSKGGSSGGLFSSFRSLGSSRAQEEPEKPRTEIPKVEKAESENQKVAPVSSMFASIQSGVTLKKTSLSDAGKHDAKRIQSLPAKNSTSMHGMLLIALESRRTNSNMEKAETCSSAASPPEFDPDSD